MGGALLAAQYIRNGLFSLREGLVWPGLSQLFASYFVVWVSAYILMPDQ